MPASLFFLQLVIHGYCFPWHTHISVWCLHCSLSESTFPLKTSANITEKNRKAGEKDVYGSAPLRELLFVSLWSVFFFSSLQTITRSSTTHMSPCGLTRPLESQGVKTCLKKMNKRVLPFITLFTRLMRNKPTLVNTQKRAWSLLTKARPYVRNHKVRQEKKKKYKI